MPKITFLQSRVVQDEHVGTAKQTRYEAGKTYDLPQASCERWVRRGLAAWAPDQPPEVLAASSQESEASDDAGDDQATDAEARADGDIADVEIPEGWRDLAWPALRSLAAKVSPDPVKPGKEAAIAAIEAELKRRAEETAAGGGRA